MSAPTHQLLLSNGLMTPQAAAFLVRAKAVATLDGPHISAYTNFINGLVLKNLFSKFDWVRPYATVSDALATLNLISSNYTLTMFGAGSYTFTTDRGYTGVDQSTTAYGDSGFNPSTASSPQFTRNSNHLAVWTLNTTGMLAPEIGYQSDGGGSSVAQIYTKYAGDGNTYIRPQNAATGGSAGVVSPKTGLMGANRSGSTQSEGYHNGSLIFTDSSTASTAVNNVTIGEMGTHNGAAGYSGCGSQQSFASCGSSLNSAEWADYYTLVRALMTAVGVP